MTDNSDRGSDLRANHRREVFKVARGSRLTGQRGQWPAAPEAKSTGAADEPAMSRQRIRLGSTIIEDEFNDTVIPKEQGYSEPND